MRQIIETIGYYVAGFLSGFLMALLHRILQVKVWVEGSFARSEEELDEFVALQVVFYTGPECEGYEVQFDLYGVTDWQDVYSALNAQHSYIFAGQEYPDGRLDVRYEVLGQRYHIVYREDSQELVFPPYQADDIRRYMNSSTQIVPILHAERAGEDVTELVTEYGGPKGNFYEDIPGVHIFPAWIPGETHSDLLITDGELVDHVFAPTSRISLLADFDPSSDSPRFPLSEGVVTRGPSSLSLSEVSTPASEPEYVPHPSDDQETEEEQNEVSEGFTLIDYRSPSSSSRSRDDA